MSALQGRARIGRVQGPASGGDDILSATRPNRKTKLPLYRPWIGDEEIQAVTDTLKSGWIGAGRRVAEFEGRFKGLVGADHAVAVNSCTAAMHLTLVAAGIGPGDEVLTTPYTFTATAEAAHHAGARVRFVDVDPDSLNLRPEDVENAIGPHTAAILTVHVAGLPCDMVGFSALAERRGLFLLDDAAHAVLATDNGSTIGSIGDASAFSFYPAKHITTAEGGMLTTSNGELAESVRRIRYHAFSRDTWARQVTQQPWSYDIVDQGFKCNMTDLQAAIGIAQLGKLDRQMVIRRHIAARYDEAFADLPQVNTPVRPDRGEHAWHLYIVRLDREALDIDRDRFIAEMQDLNIDALVHYIPLHFFTHYQSTCGVKAGDFPNAEAAFSRVVSLPFWPGMSDQDTDDVIATVRYLVARHAR